MEVQRAIDILTPGKVRYTPQEYEEALEMARNALCTIRAYTMRQGYGTLAGVMPDGAMIRR